VTDISQAPFVMAEHKTQSYTLHRNLSR